MTSTQQKSILRGSEIFGYDEKEYPERMLQRAAGWCKAVQGVRGKILSELSGRMGGVYAPVSRNGRPPLSRAAHCWMRTEGPGFAPAIRVVPQRSLYAFVSYEP